MLGGASFLICQSGITDDASRLREPLRVYALLELGIGIFGLAVIAGMPLVGELDVASIGLLTTTCVAAAINAALR